MSCLRDFLEIPKDLVEIPNDFLEIPRDFLEIPRDFLEIPKDFLEIPSNMKTYVHPEEKVPPPGFLVITRNPERF